MTGHRAEPGDKPDPGIVPPPTSRLASLRQSLAEPRWRVTLFLALAAAINYADRAAISSVLPPLREDLGLSDAQLGMLGALFLWSYALGSVVSGNLADRHSRSRLVLVSLILWSLVTALTGLTHGVVMLFVLRIGLGIFESIFHPAAYALIADHHGGTTRGRAMSIISVGFHFGVVAGGSVAGYIADHFGWRWSFIVLGGLGLMLALPARWLLADAPRVASAAPPAQASTRAAILYLLQTRTYLMFLLKAMLTGIAMWVFLAWLPLYFKETFHLTLGAAGFAGTFMLQGALVVGIAVGGWISDAVARGSARRRMFVLGLCYVLAAPLLLAFLGHATFAVIATAVSVFSVLRGIGVANEQPAICEIVPPCYRSTAFGVMNAFATAVGGIGVFFTGVLKATHGLGAIFGGISIVFLGAGLAILVGYYVWAPRDIARAALFTRPVAT